MAKCPKCSSPSIRKSRKQAAAKTSKQRLRAAYRCDHCGARFVAADRALIGGVIVGGSFASLFIAWLAFGGSGDDAFLRQNVQDRTFETEQSLALGYTAVADGDDSYLESDDGSPLTQYRLALRFFSQFEHTGDPADLRTAHRFLLNSSAQGHPEAQSELGTSYLNGRGVVQDFPLAADWFKKAAENGVPKAMYELGKMAMAGWGMEQSLPEAYVWLNLASARGDTRARDTRRQLLSRLSNEELKEAQRRSRELDKTIPKG